MATMSTQITQDRELFAKDVERLAEAGLSNADIGRALEVHRNAVFYWRRFARNEVAAQLPSRHLVLALRSKLDELLEQNGLIPSQ